MKILINLKAYNMKFFVIFISLFSTLNANAINLDIDLSEYIQKFKMKPITKPTGFNKSKFDLGKKLFFDNILSGNREVSCSSCHDPKFGTGDALPLPLGVGAKGIGTNRIGHNSPIIPRNAPPLYNMNDKAFMFWDGRVSYDGFEFKTPEPGLNGEYPEYIEIVKALENAVAAQALFPPTSHEEMRGHNNEIADAKSNLEVWQKLMKRLFLTNKYPALFKSAYPNTLNFNIGHMASALAHFQIHNFSITNTPWDNYLKGQTTSLTSNEKKGAITFFSSGKCINCHSGDHFGGSSFRAVAAPQLGPGKDIHKNDEGRFLVTKRRSDLYKFKTPMLRNVSKTAPYFHSGAYQTLEDVVNHYSFGTRSLDEYSETWLSSFEIKNYNDKLFIERDPYKLFKKKENAHPLLRNHLIRLTNDEKSNLVLFLKRGLTQVE